MLLRAYREFVKDPAAREIRRGWLMRLAVSEAELANIVGSGDADEVEHVLERGYIRHKLVEAGCVTRS